MLWWDVSETTPGVFAPWRQDARPFFAHLQKQIAYGSMALGLLRPDQPMPDEILVSQGWLRKSIDQWCQTGFASDPLFKEARQNGVAAATRQESHQDLSLPVRQYQMMVMVPETLPDRWWWMLLARDTAPFTDLEKNLAGLILRQLQTSFNQVSEKGMCRFILGHDSRLIHADPAGQAWMLHRPGVFEELVDQMHRISSQRWPSLESESGHDFAIDVGGTPTWVCFYVTGASDHPSSRRWYIETRELGADELPLVGVLEDDRVAQAVGYIHDHFQEAPSLAQVAQAVHISPFHFHRLFSKLVKVSPKQYLQRKQLQAAKWMLRTTRLPIGMVAIRSGFSSHGHFTSTFHRVVGAIPSQYREEG